MIYIVSLQHRVYARWRNGSLLWASIPVVFKNCASPFGSLPGCLFRYDDPDDQCKDNRTGGYRYGVLATNQELVIVGFLCGKCPEGQVVDLTFSRCVECKEWHAFMIAAIGEYISIEYMTAINSLIYMQLWPLR